jgi:hypothetical protein
MTLRRELRTNKYLWAVCSLFVFILLGFVDFVPESKGGVQYWHWWAVLFEGAYPWERFMFPMAMMTLMIAIPSLAVAWVLQALCVVAAACVRHRDSSGADESRVSYF